jgi:hypothetical protein
MKKNKLLITYDFDFNLTGITTAIKGYKLAWEINQRLGVHLVRQPDLVVGFRNMEERQFSFYAHETRLNRLKLFKNKPVESSSSRFVLVPEFPHFDFILLTQGDDPAFTEMALARIKQIDVIELVVPLPVETLKSKANFVF